MAALGRSDGIGGPIFRLFSCQFRALSAEDDARNDFLVRANGIRGACSQQVSVAEHDGSSHGRQDEIQGAEVTRANLKCPPT